MDPNERRRRLVDLMQSEQGAALLDLLTEQRDRIVLQFRAEGPQNLERLSGRYAEISELIDSLSNMPTVEEHLARIHERRRHLAETAPQGHPSAASLPGAKHGNSREEGISS